MSETSNRVRVSKYRAGNIAANACGEGGWIIEFARKSAGVHGNPSKEISEERGWCGLVEVSGPDGVSGLGAVSWFDEVARVSAF